MDAAGEYFVYEVNKTNNTRVLALGPVASDLAPVSMLAAIPNMLVANHALAANTVPALIVVP